jgi:clan AA aspartic protease (TIGR02281 family)
MRKLRLAALAAVVALVASPVLARKSRVSIESRGRMLVIEASINQRVTGRFLLDTGASFCVISKDLAAEAGLSGRKDGPKAHLTTAGGIVVEATIGEARRIDIGDAVARDVQVAVVEGNPTPGLQGVIGLSFLQHFKYSVEADGRALLLEN